MSWLDRRLASGLALALLVGCAPSRIRVLPQGTDVTFARSQWPAASVRVPETGPGGLDVRVRSPGVFRRDHEGDGSVALAVEVEIENRSESVVAAFDPGGATLRTALRNELSPVGTPGDAKRSSSDATEVPIQPGERRTFHLEFATRATDDPRELAPFSVRLPLRYGQSERAVAVTFVREPDDYYYDDGYYDGYHHGPYHRGYYYGPYYHHGPYYGSYYYNRGW